jgi:hypothetical protein
MVVESCSVLSRGTTERPRSYHETNVPQIAAGDGSCGATTLDRSDDTTP